MDDEELIDELSKLRMFNPEEFKKRMNNLRVNNPRMFNKVVSTLGVDVSKLDVMPQQVSPKKPTIKRNDNNIGILIITMLVFGMIIIGIIFFFISGMPTTTNVNMDAINSAKLGFELFNNQTNKYLQYSLVHNISDGNVLINSIGREYYYFNNGDYTSVLFSNDYTCDVTSCILTNPNNYIISRRTNDLTTYDYQDSCESFNTGFNYPLALTIYNELYFLINNDLVTESSREEVWTINEEDCAPIYFYIESSDLFLPQGTELNELLYELCLNNEGIPLAIGKYYSYTGHDEIYIYYLESTDETLIGNTDLNGQTLNELKQENLNC